MGYTDNYDYLFKILLIGNSGVGKSSIVKMYSDGLFCDNYFSTIGVDFKVKTIDVDNKVVKMQIWDTAGQERFRSIVNTYYRGAQGIFIVYDVCNKKSFNDVDQIWKKEMRRNTIDKFIHVFLIGNKSDLYTKREVSFEEGANYAAENGFSFIETSAKNNNCITDAFSQMAITIKDKIVSGRLISNEKLTVALIENEKENAKQKQKKCAC